MKYFYMLVIALLCGCGTTPMIKVEPKEVQVVVVAPYPTIPAIPHPILEISKLTDNPAPGLVVQAYQITVQQLLNLVEQLETQISGVNKNARPTSPVAN